MTSNDDPTTGLLDRLAAYREHLTRLDTREIEHYTLLHGQLVELTDLAASINRTQHDHAAVLAELARPSQAVAEADGYCPGSAPAWWKLPAEGREEPVARLRAWVEQVYRPGFGHLAASLGPCWDQHDLCLYGIDILAELWSALYLQPARTPALLSGQAEYQARILPALADQLRIETNRCGHPRHPAPPDGQPWRKP